MAIRDGHDDNAGRPTRRQRRARQANTPGLFVRSLIAQSNVTTSVGCDLLGRLKHGSQGASSTCARNGSCRELLVASGSRVTLHTVEEMSETLREVGELDLYSTIHDLGVVQGAPRGVADTVVAVLGCGSVAFITYNDTHAHLNSGGALCVSGRVTLCTDSQRGAQQPRLVAIHPDGSLCAVASVSSSISVFPIVPLRRGVTSGKIITVDVDGVILSLDFLERECGRDSLLLVLVQRGSDQYVEVHLIGDDVGDASEGGLLGSDVEQVRRVTRVGSMMTGWEYLEDSMIARHTAKLGGGGGSKERKRVEAYGISRIPGHAYLYVVYHEGRIVVGDAHHCLDRAAEILTRQEAGRRGPRRWINARGETPSDSNLYITLAEPGVTAALGERGEAAAYTLEAAPQASGLPAVHPPRHLTLTDPFLLALIHPVCVRLEVSENDGAPTAWTRGGNFVVDDDAGASALYVAMESGTLYALTWSGSPRRSSFKVPVQDKALHSVLPNFRAERVGDIGATISLSVLSDDLLYVGGDCGDCSLRGVGSGLEVKEVFLNLAPICDMVVVPAGGVRKPTSRVRLRARERDCWASISSSSPRSQGTPGQLQAHAQRQFARYSKSSFSPASGAASDTSEGRSPLAVSPNSDHTCGSTRSARTRSRTATRSRARARERVSNDEPEVILACGVQKSGSIRMVKPGAPVTVFSSSAPNLAGCTDLWNVRISQELQVDTLLLASFVSSSRVLFSAPGGGALISQLLDGTDACDLVSTVRTIAVGRVAEGVIAQVHAQGVRTVSFLESSELPRPLRIENGRVCCALVRRESTRDWCLQAGETITTAAVGCGLVLLALSRDGARSPCFVVLGRTGGELKEVARVELSCELSFICIPEWLHANNGSECPVILLGTRTPSVEVWTLQGLLRTTVTKMQPWFSASPEAIMQYNSPARAAETLEESVLGSFPSENGRFGDHCTLSEHGWPAFMKTWTPQKVLESSVMTCVPESIVCFESAHKRYVLVGLRNGTILRYSLVSPTHTRNKQYKLILVSRRRLGDVPIRLFNASLPRGAAIIAQAERPWVTLLDDIAQPNWVPLSFQETRAWCNYSTRGAERCLATVTSDDTLHICGIRRLANVTVTSIRIGDTPRRVLPLYSPSDTILVATSCEPDHRDDHSQHSVAYSQLRVYDKHTKRLLGGVRLLRGELVHVTLQLGDFVVVGTSIGMRDVTDFGPLGGCKKGRLLLYSINSVHSAHSALTHVTFELCCEIRLPGAVLAGATRPEHSTLIVSCNSTIIMFGLLRYTLFEIARTAARMQVLSITTHGSTICVADRKDSVSFFTLDPDARGIVRQRTDDRKRLVADACIVDPYTALASDKLGALFTVAYEQRDREEASINAHTSTDDDWYHMYVGAAMACGLIDGGGLSSTLGDSDGDSMSLLNSDADGDDGGTITGTNYSESVQDTHLSIATANSEYMDDVEVEEVEGASIVETAGTTDAMLVGDPDDGDEVGNVGVGVGIGGGVGAAPPPAESPGTPPMGILPNPHITTPPLRNKLVANVLVADHAYGLQDTALRVRKAVFRRRETIAPIGVADRADEFWRDTQHCVLAGTLGGALVAAVPVAAGALAVLDAVAYALFDSPAEQAAFDQHRQCCGVVDGDHVMRFLKLDEKSKQQVCAKAGLGTAAGVVAQVDALIHELCDSVA